DRWEELKPYIEHLYLDKGLKLADVVTTMKDEHRFDMKWKSRKNLSSAKKETLTATFESRARAGKSSTSVTLHGVPVESKKMRRYWKSKARDQTQNMALETPSAVRTGGNGPVLFLKWNLPFASMRRTYISGFDHASPHGVSAPTPGSDISVDTPSTAASPHARSPTASVLANKVKNDRAYLFVQGQHDRLLNSLNGREREVMSEWLYQYWFFCFKTSKHWGRGPLAWTAQLLDFEQFRSRHARSLPATPADILHETTRSEDHQPQPLNLCRWFIHVEEVIYEDFPEVEPPGDPYVQDPRDEVTWSQWPAHEHKPPLSTRLRDALEHNDFSTVPTANLPVAVPSIAKAAQRCPDELLLEALGFSIMSRNIDQIHEISSKLQANKYTFGAIFPLHLAIEYLDGYKSCCGVVAELLQHLPYPRTREIYLNEAGHTLIDSLMISILKSHSSMKHADVDISLKDNVRFAGEEVDICGRWDADSPCMRRLLSDGTPCTPFDWKHKFCHTSTQAVCHSIAMLNAGLPHSWMIETPSGLYIRRCFVCGLKMQLQPLHSLVVTAFHLANHSCQDEDLFGILAALLCLLSFGHDPRSTADVSIAALIQTVDADDIEVLCAHEKLTPAGLAERLSSAEALHSWEVPTQTGWAVFRGIL
ncbi:hypothetical protein EK21DRAFT_16038, partial [Setomelanomma holmii]